MQSCEINNEDLERQGEDEQAVNAGWVDDLPVGSCKTIDLPEGRELALYNVNGEFYATENFCPHKGAPLSAGRLCEHTIECDWHGWQFDVRTGECLTVREKLETYEVVVEGGVIKVLI